jgi:flagellar biosynthesis/type III secretory pathway protein FliH
VLTLWRLLASAACSLIACRTGYSVGRKKGQREAYQLGYAHGRTAGHVEGYRRGFEEGRRAALARFRDDLDAIASALDGLHEQAAPAATRLPSLKVDEETVRLAQELSRA